MLSPLRAPVKSGFSPHFVVDLPHLLVRPRPLGVQRQERTLSLALAAGPYENLLIGVSASPGRTGGLVQLSAPLAQPGVL
jgi:hypothetical protein